jgi:hypothetical protein
MSLRTILKWAVIIFIAYYVFSNPAAAGAVTRGLWADIVKAGHQFSVFLASL